MPYPRMAVFAAIAVAGLLTPSIANAQMILPEGFVREDVLSSFSEPVDFEFAEDGRFFVAEKAGRVWVVENGVELSPAFIDLTAEVDGGFAHGLMAVAVDPDFLINRYVYLFYTVETGAGTTPSFTRITRYTGTVESDGNVADPASRLVLLGDTPAEGVPVCHQSHMGGTIEFGTDGSMFICTGDGGRPNGVDAGGQDPDCFGEGMFPADQDIGAFRAQYLQSLSGKLLRIDPATGLGYPDNPYYTGDGNDIQSKIWANGLRNPFRMTVRPGSTPPGSLYISDVGWGSFEEVNVARGGENFGWPCYEGPNASSGYQNAMPPNGGCDTIDTPANPGPLTESIIAWHRTDGSQSIPKGPTGQCVSGAAFYTHGNYPAVYHGGYFVTDHTASWLRFAQVNASDELVSFNDFGTRGGKIVDVETHPVTGDVYYLALFAHKIFRIRYENPADLNGDGDVNAADLAIVLGQWGPCPGCDADLNDDGVVNAADLAIVLGSWGL